MAVYTLSLVPNADGDALLNVNPDGNNLADETLEVMSGQVTPILKNEPTPSIRQPGLLLMLS